MRWRIWKHTGWRGWTRADVEQWLINHGLGGGWRN